ncbi:MAG: hypothetical protein AAFR21_15220 [Pseudomonadota bacterium]
MDSWEALSQAVGGDLWSNPEKAAIVRQIDKEMQGASWEDFHNAVVTKISAMPQNTATISHDIS